MAYLWEQRLGRLSIQVLQEYYVTVTAKLNKRAACDVLLTPAIQLPFGLSLS